MVAISTRKQGLVFIHGSGGNHSAWSHQYARLHKKYNIVAIIFRGMAVPGNGEKDVRCYCVW